MQEIQEIQERPCGATDELLCEAAKPPPYNSAADAATALQEMQEIQEIQEGG